MKKVLFALGYMVIALPVVGMQESQVFEPYIQLRPQLQVFIQSSQMAKLPLEIRNREKMEEIRTLAEHLKSRLDEFMGSLRENDSVEALSQKLMSVLYDDMDLGEQVSSLRKNLLQIFDIWEQAIKQQDLGKQNMIRHKVAHFFANCDDYQEINEKLKDLADRADQLIKGEVG